MLQVRLVVLPLAVTPSLKLQSQATTLPSGSVELVPLKLTVTGDV